MVTTRPTFCVITVVRNRRSTILENLRSVDSQTYARSITHIIIDGASNDGTLEVIKSFDDNSQVSRIIHSEPDEGIYDALNKGFAKINGDFVGILHSDDVFHDRHVVEDIVNVFVESKAQLLYCNVNLVGPENEFRGAITPHKRASRTLFPDQVSHMGLFMSATAAKHLEPPFDKSYRIAADVKHQLLLLDHSGFTSKYYNRTVVDFKIGGLSTQSFKFKALGIRESVRAWNEVNVFGGLLFVILKILRNIYSRTRR